MEIPRGKLIPIGGNEVGRQEDNDYPVFNLNNSVLKEIIAEIDRPQPVIEVLPIASRQQKEAEEKYREVFRELGVGIGVITANARFVLHSQREEAGGR